jgi:hypothetical protein
MPAWYSDAELKIELAAELKKKAANPALVASYIDTIIGWANKRAKGQIKHHWLKLGYTLAQIETDWDEETRLALHLSQSLYWIDVRLLQLFENTESEYHVLKNVLPELEAMTLLDEDGEPIELPEDDVTSEAANGVLDVRDEFDRQQGDERERRGLSRTNPYPWAH